MSDESTQPAATEAPAAEVPAEPEKAFEGDLGGEGDWDNPLRDPGDRRLP